MIMVADDVSPSGFDTTPREAAEEETETLSLTASGGRDDHPTGFLSAVPAALHDPLLNPGELPSLESPSSSSRFVDPPSYDDAVFSPFDPLQNGNVDGDSDGADGGGSASAAANVNASSTHRRDSSLSRSRRSAVSEYSKITVSDPQKEQEIAASSLVPGSGTFVTYLITTRTAGGVDDGGGAMDYRVRRRFRDVVALAERLAESYRGFFIPPRPDKSVVEGQLMHKHEFVEQRRGALEKYLHRLAAHPVIGRSDELKVFLTAPGKSPLGDSTDLASSMWDSAVRLPRQLVGNGGRGYTAVPSQDIAQPAKGGRDLMRIFRELKQSMTTEWGGAKSMTTEEDQEFLERKGKIQDLEQQLTTASQQAEVLVKAQHDIAESMGDLGLKFFKLGKFEIEQAAHQSQTLRATEIKHFATAAVKASRFYRELNAQTVKYLDTFHDYLGMMLAVNSAFSDRSSALLNVQTLMSDLSSLHSQEEKPGAASRRFFGGDKSRFQKVEELKETIRLKEDAKNHAIREYERIKENNRYELERLDKERREDFLVMLKGFVVNQVGFAEKIATVWTNEAEETRKYIRRHD